MNPTGRKYERRNDSDVFTSFRWNATIVEPTRIVPARESIAKHFREQVQALLHEWPAELRMYGPSPLRVVVCGDNAMFTRTFQALHQLDLSERSETARPPPAQRMRRRRGRTERPAEPRPVVEFASSKSSVLCARRESELMEIGTSGQIDLLLINPDRLMKEPEWLPRDICLAAEDGYPPAVVIVEDEEPDPYGYPGKLHGTVVGTVRQTAPLDDWIEMIRRAPARRMTSLLGEGARQRARDCGLVDGPVTHALSALFFDVAQLVPFTPARDAGMTLAALAVDEIEWRPDRPLPEPRSLDQRAMSSARKHLARRLTRLGLPSADTVITLVRTVYAIAIARSWRVSLDDAARYAGFQTARQLMTACTRVGGGRFSLLCERPDLGALLLNFALMLFRDYWHDGHARFDWTFLDIRLPPRPVVVRAAHGAEVVVHVVPD